MGPAAFIMINTKVGRKKHNHTKCLKLTLLYENDLL